MSKQAHIIGSAAVVAAAAVIVAVSLPSPEERSSREGRPGREGHPGETSGATAPESVQGAQPENVVSTLKETWEEQAPRIPEHGVGPITDDDWPDHPCHRLVEVVTGAVAADDATVAALVADVDKHHLRNQTLDVKTWTYAACAALDGDGFAPCRTRIDGVDEKRCIELVNRAHLVRPADSVAACLGGLDVDGEPPAMQRVMERLCRAQRGDAHACDDFPLRDFAWVCRAHLDGDVKGCAAVPDPNARAECVSLVDLVRAGRGLPPQTGDDLDPDVTLTLVYRKVVDPKLDCAAWYEQRVRDLCY